MLKYLFVAEFADHSIIEQTQEDVSALYEGLSDAEIIEFNRQVSLDTTSTDEAMLEMRKSRFFDVLNYPAPLVAFSLVGEGNIFTVNLLTLNFTVNGVGIRTYNKTDLPLYAPELFYMREVEHDTIIHLKDGEQVGRTPGERRVCYRMGFRAKRASGEIFERIIEID